MTKLRKKQVKEAKRFSKYLVGGNAQFWSGYGAFALFDAVMGINFWPAKIVSYFIGVSVNFVIERFWAFGNRRVSQRQVETSAQRYYSLMLVNFGLDLAIVGGLRELGLTPYLGQFVSAGFFTMWNYLLFKWWVFRRKRRGGAGSRTQSAGRPRAVSPRRQQSSGRQLAARQLRGRV